MPTSRELTKLSLSRARDAFLSKLAETGQITKSAKFAKVTRQTAYAWREKDEDFRKAWFAALDLASDMLEDVAFNRATRAMNPSDSLLTLLLKAHKAEKYRDRSDIQMSGTVELSQKLQKARERVSGGT